MERGQGGAVGMRIECAPLTGCVTCGASLKPRRSTCGGDCRKTFEVNHFWWAARRECLRRTNNLCARCWKQADEVNHIKPISGGIRWITCLNHQENLEALCHSCHLDFTYPSRIKRHGADTETQGEQGTLL